MYAIRSYYDRLVIRDTEWLVKSARNIENNNWILDVVGLSEVVRDKESQFVTKFEKDRNNFVQHTLYEVIRGLNSFTDDFMEDGREQGQNQERESF